MSFSLIFPACSKFRLFPDWKMPSHFFQVFQSDWEPCITYDALDLTVQSPSPTWDIWWLLKHYGQYKRVIRILLECFLVTARRHLPPGADTSPRDQRQTQPTPTPEETPVPCAVHAGRYGQQAGGTHPTGMHTCLCIVFGSVAHFSWSTGREWLIRTRLIRSST